MENILMETEMKMESSIENMEKRFGNIRAGRANPAILDSVMVTYYGTPTPLKQLATISIPEARQLAIKPYDRSTIGDIERAIFEANIGLTPNNNGEMIILTIPELTEERRRELVKQVKALSEDAKVTVRNLRREALEDVSKCELPEDQEKGMEKDIQDIVNEYNKKIEAKLKEKEQELLTV